MPNIKEKECIYKLQNAAAHHSLCGDLFYFYRRFAAFELTAKDTGKKTGYDLHESVELSWGESV